MSQTTSQTTDDGRAIIDLGADERCELLAADRRRAVLAVLDGRGTPTALDELAEAVAAREREEAGGRRRPMRALCPDCGDHEGGVVERTSAESGARVTFRYPGCDHGWEVPL